MLGTSILVGGKKNAAFCYSLPLLVHDVCSACCSPSQIGHRDLDVEKRLRRDLRRTRALLADAQLLLAAPTEPGATGTAELQRLQKQVGTKGCGGRAAGGRASLCPWAQPHCAAGDAVWGHHCFSRGVSRSPCARWHRRRDFVGLGAM